MSKHNNFPKLTNCQEASGAYPKQAGHFVPPPYGPPPAYSAAPAGSQNLSGYAANLQQQRFVAAPQGYTAAPQGYAAAPQGYTAVPRGYTAAPQVYTAGPQVYPAVPQGYAAAPQGYAAAPQGYAAAPQGYAEVSANTENGQSYINVGQIFDAGARFDGIAKQTIPPPPPGYTPTDAQVAAAMGYSVVAEQKKRNFWTGD